MTSLRCVLVSLAYFLLIGSAYGQLPMGSMQIAAQNLPKPQINPGDLPRPCIDVRDRSKPPVRQR